MYDKPNFEFDFDLGVEVLPGWSIRNPVKTDDQGATNQMGKVSKPKTDRKRDSGMVQIRTREHWGSDRVIIELSCARHGWTGRRIAGADLVDIFACNCIEWER